jgi:hypothetical protein
VPFMRDGDHRVPVLSNPILIPTGMAERRRVN